MPKALPPDASIVAELVTVRDWLRYGVSEFTRAGLVFGHGTTNALDEAAFLILMALSLPIDQLEPWLEARLTTSERAKVAGLIRARIETRKPASYLVNAAFIQGRRFYVDERVIVPRSYIGEMLCSDGLSAIVPDASSVSRVLDVCTGSGCLAILAAEAFPRAEVDAVELSSDALAVAQRNVDDYELGARIHLIKSDLFATIDANVRYDLIIANPPYVAAAEVHAFAPEYRAEPVMAHIGGDDGLDLVRRIVDGAAAHLAPDGHLVMEIGTGREALEAAYSELEFLWLDSEASEGEVLAIAAKGLLPKPARSRKVRETRS